MELTKEDYLKVGIGDEGQAEIQGLSWKYYPDYEPSKTIFVNKDKLITKLKEISKEASLQEQINKTGHSTYIARIFTLIVEMEKAK